MGIVYSTYNLLIGMCSLSAPLAVYNKYKLSGYSTLNYIYYVYSIVHLALSSLYYLTKLVSRTTTTGASLLRTLLRLFSDCLPVSTCK